MSERTRLFSCKQLAPDTCLSARPPRPSALCYQVVLLPSVLLFGVFAMIDNFRDTELSVVDMVSRAGHKDHHFSALELCSSRCPEPQGCLPDVHSQEWLGQ